MKQEVKVIQKVKDVLLRSKKRHRIIYGGRGKGASWSIARILLLQGMREPLFIPCVREVQKTLQYSVKKLLEDTIELFHWEWFYDITKSEIVSKVNGTKFVFFGMQDYNADNVKSLEGADICWVAEAQTMSRRSINVLRPTIRKQGSVIWWDFNPRYETDAVWIDYILNHDDNAEVLKLSFRDNPWMTDALIMEMESDFARNEDEARHIWDGELRIMGDMFVCPSKLVDVAISNKIEKLSTPDIVVGADIAHQGGDRISFYKRQGRKVIDEYESRYQSTVKTIAHLKGFIGDKTIPVNIDNGSVGAAVADFLEEDGYMVRRINFGGKPEDAEHYEDTATEMYFGLRDVLSQADIPNDVELRAQLIQRKCSFVNGRRGYEVQKIESKDDFMEHAMIEYDSPDKADALVLCYYDPGSAGVIGTISHNIF